MLLDQVIFDKTKVPVLNAVLDVTQVRQRVIANNIANVSTKGFRAKDVRFQDYLSSFVHQSPVQGETSDQRHLSIPDGQSSPQIFEVQSDVNDSGLNNVDIDREMAGLAENHLFFNVGSTLIQRQFAGLKKSITGRTA
ncbi:MAG: flagellar basal body rod protein FlgB [Candidatus Latescibacteria bacterium]|nr:flagellar basal body rod protein FlgB [Candidatus Latescibacterota bacterium]